MLFKQIPYICDLIHIILVLIYPLAENIDFEILLGHSTIYKRSDGIIEIRCANDFTYDVEHIKENHHFIEELTEGKKALILNISEKYTSITSEARDYISKGHHENFIKAEAFLIHSLAQRILANFFIKMTKPKVPANYFDYKDKEKAEAWLTSFLK